ncbi:hypothetical protein [Microbacterium sp. BR1]|uniref:hypothetical protein n=1 Tax=Microbacterium sp. BR1 TaxID=1070896 RepID=UPI001E4DD95E|nr:hypothetical protein [Microbacterium sp. BR1]
MATSNSAYFATEIPTSAPTATPAASRPTDSCFAAFACCSVTFACCSCAGFAFADSSPTFFVAAA